jgi:DNA-binding XRE family transcriptional regulator
MLQLQKSIKKEEKNIMDQDDHISETVHYRKRMKFTQLQVMSILGWKNKKGLALIESGKVVPTLTTALKLAIIYRVPVEFLFASLHRKLLQQIRSREQSLAPVGQRPLPLTVSNVHDS